MYMDRLIVKGGYGEHGRSCFLVPFAQGRYYMLDCGIMDTDENPWPEVETELLERTEYLFLSHCHKDHSGAFSRLVSRGFRGWLVAAGATVELAGICYNKVIQADPLSAWPMGLGRELHFSCGRSGHCVGGLWFHIWDSGKSCFYSGDYQPGPLAFAVDQVKGRRADLAIVDCAHPATQEDARALRSRILEWIGPCLAAGRRVVLPLPRYGRGLELIALIKENFPQVAIAADQGFAAAAEQMCGYGQWLRAGKEEQIRAFLEEQPEERLERDRYDVLLLAYFPDERKAHILDTLKIVSDTNEQIAYLRSSVIGLLIGECTRAFLDNEVQILEGEFEGSLIKHITERPAAAYQHCAEVSFKKIYRSRDVLDIELAGFRIISTLLELMIDAVRSPEKAYSQLLINRVSGQYNMKATALYERIQAVLDYISGMTDVFALDLYRKINGNSLPAV